MQSFLANFTLVCDLINNISFLVVSAATCSQLLHSSAYDKTSLYTIAKYLIATLDNDIVPVYSFCLIYIR